MRKTITMLFDSILRTQSGKCIPYYDTVWTEEDTDDKYYEYNKSYDGKLQWMHERYGSFWLYRMHRIDNTDTYVMEPLHHCIRNTSPEFEKYIYNAELYLKDHVNN